jgi:uncharacterized membrane protein YfcA
MNNPLLLSLLVFLIATLYASAGFGGASGYLTAMSFFKIPVNVMASTALVLNILVSSISFSNYTRAGHLKPKLLFPFLITSIPAAFLGGYLKISERTYTTLLYLVLTYLAVRMLCFRTPAEAANWQPHPITWGAALLTGAIIGLLSGMLGMGGGIFLSPLILVMQWGSGKQAAASAGGFIAINSLSGLVGRILGGTLEFGQFGLWLLPAGLLGALIGSQMGAIKLSATGVRRALGIILTLAVGTYWLNILFAL